MKINYQWLTSVLIVTTCYFGFNSAHAMEDDGFDFPKISQSIMLKNIPNPLREEDGKKIIRAKVAGVLGELSLTAPDYETVKQWVNTNVMFLKMGNFNLSHQTTQTINGKSTTSSTKVSQDFGYSLMSCKTGQTCKVTWKKI